LIIPVSRAQRRTQGPAAGQSRVWEQQFLMDCSALALNRLRKKSSPFRALERRNSIVEGNAPRKYDRSEPTLEGSIPTIDRCKERAGPFSLPCNEQVEIGIRSAAEEGKLRLPPRYPAPLISGANQSEEMAVPGGGASPRSTDATLVF
jgi:hypothetical protein